jgi:hypothetical protein
MLKGCLAIVALVVLTTADAKASFHPLRSLRARVAQVVSVGKVFARGPVAQAVAAPVRTVAAPVKRAAVGGQSCPGGVCPLPSAKK